MTEVKVATGAGRRRPYFGVLELELELLLEQWDVLGVYGAGGHPADPACRTAQQHEYDDLVRPIIAHLMDSDDEESLEAALLDVLRDDYGVEVEPDDLRAFVRSVVGWWRSR